MKPSENHLLVQPHFGIRSVYCGALLYLLYLALVGADSVPGSAWLGLYWAVLFNVGIVAASNLSTVRYGIFPVALAAVLLSQTTQNPILRYVLSMSMFALLSLLAVGICRMPPWTVGQRRSRRGRPMTIRGILAVTTTVAIVLAAHAEFAKHSGGPVWLRLVSDQLPLIVVLLAASCASLARKYPRVAVAAALATVVAVPALKTAVFFAQHPSYPSQLFLQNYFQLLPLYTVAAVATFVFNWCGRLDQQAFAANAAEATGKASIEIQG